MADITSELTAIAEAEYGEEVRGSIIAAISAMNTESSDAKKTATDEKESAKAYAEAAAEHALDIGTKVDDFNNTLESAKSEIDQKAEQTAGHAESVEDILNQIIAIRDQILEGTSTEEALLDSDGEAILDSAGEPIKVLKITANQPSGDGSGGFNLDKVYPIGAIYMSVNSTDPGELFGGIWESFSRGRVPVGVDLEDEDYNEAEKLGGSKHHIISEVEIPHLQFSFSGSTTVDLTHFHPVNITSGGMSNDHVHTFSTSATGNHRHDTGYIRDAVAGTNKDRITDYDNSNKRGNIHSSYSGEHYHTGTTNIENANHTHVVSGNTNNGLSSKTITISGDTSPQTHAQTSLDLCQPYITCYMWKRVE